MIKSLTEMITHLLKTYMRYRKDVEKNANPAPRRMLFYRDGISEGNKARGKIFNNATD
ncbi:hypothetical protein FRC00_000443, partial [Tulasnella sp. 408]